MSKLDASRLEALFKECLFRDGEDTSDYVSGEGIVRNFGFNPDRLESHRREISEMLAELPVEFHEGSGDGMSFLNACCDKDGRQWGEHRNMEMLFAIGQALGKVQACAPREMWTMLPGGMPYYVVLKEAREVTHGTQSSKTNSG